MRDALQEVLRNQKPNSNAKPVRTGFKSAANVADKSEIESNDLRNYLDVLSNATRAEKEQMNQTDSTNEEMVELRQQLT